MEWTDPKYAKVAQHVANQRTRRGVSTEGPGRCRGCRGLREIVLVGADGGITARQPCLYCRGTGRARTRQTS